MSDVTQILHALRSHTILRYHPKRGVVGISGSDARDFLQRMSTNNIVKLNKKSPLQTSFVNNKGRIIDHCIMYELKHDQIIIVSSHENGLLLQNWLEQFHFVEDFLLTDMSEKISVSYLISSAPHTPSAPIMWRARLLDMDLSFCCSDEQQKNNSILIDKNMFETLRIAALMPASPNEINEQWMPQNINLEQFISEDKGCYIGQEVIAKARTYQKNVKTLQGVSLTSDEYAQKKIGDHISDDHKKPRIITSIAPFYVPSVSNALVIG